MRLLLHMILVATFAAALVLPEPGSALATDDHATDAPCTGVSAGTECTFSAMVRYGPSCSQLLCVLGNPADLSLRPRVAAAKALTNTASAWPTPVYTIDKPPKEPRA